jgi:hypothetical protein
VAATEGAARKAAPRHKEVVAFEKVSDALRVLDRGTWRNGHYEGGRDEVQHMLIYFCSKYGVSYSQD